MMSEQKIESLIKELTCEDVIRCQKARRALVDIGHEAVPSLIKALESRHEWVRWEAARELAIGYATLKRLLDNPPPSLAVSNCIDAVKVLAGVPY